jgi:hypothetical protein
MQMKLQTLPPPDDVKQELGARIRDLIDDKDPLLKPLLEFEIVIRIFAPNVYDLQSLASQDLQPTAWRFMAAKSTVALIAADVAVGPPPRLMCVSRDKVLGEVLLAILARIQTFNPSDYILVRIPEVLTDALWMRTANDILIAPLRTKARGLEQQAYAPSDFVSIISALVEEFNPPDGGPPIIPFAKGEPKGYKRSRE